MKISINEPCHENWDKMTPNDKGAFCLSCQKNVVDFSSKTISQIKDFFKKKTGEESICGRFNERQLNALTFDDFLKEFMSWKLVQKTALIVFFVFGLSLFGMAQTGSGNHHVKMGKIRYIPQDTTQKNCKKDTLEKRHLKGEINYVPAKQDPPHNKKKKPEELLIEDKNTKSKSNEDKH